MSVLGIWVLASLLGCCIGYVVLQRPAEYYDYQNQPYAYQWQPLEYQPPDYPPSYYSSYYYYYPLSFGFPESPPSIPGPRLSFDEAQKLLQVYRLIRVIDIFREPIKTVTSLDRLVQQLTNDTIQEQLVELLCHVDGYEEVAALVRGPPGLDLDLFVDNIGRLLLAIQRSLNALDLDDDDYHRSILSQGYAGLPETLRKQLRQFRDVANALTVAQIEQELKDGSKSKAKEALVTDLLENLTGEEDEDSSLVDEFNENFDVVDDDEDSLALDNVDKYVVVIDDVEKEQQSQKPQFSQEDLDKLANVLEHYLEQQKMAEDILKKEKSQEKPVLLKPSVDPTTSTTTTSTTPPTPVPSTISEKDRDSWLDHLFGKGNLKPNHQTIDVSQPAELIEPEVEEANAWVHEDDFNKNALDFDIDQRFQVHTSTEKSSTLSTVAHSLPMWLTKKPVLKKDENKKSGYEILNKTERHLLRELPNNEEVTTEEASVEASEGEARELPIDQEKLVEEQIDEPNRFDLLADLTEHKVKDSTPVPIAGDVKLEHRQLDEQSTTEAVSEEATSQSAPNIYEVHTEKAQSESRDEMSSLPTTDHSEPRNYKLLFRPVDIRHPEMANLVPHIIQQLRLGNVSEQERFTLETIFEDLWPLIMEEAFRSD
ncbi:uncharacterized protein LOC134226847 isoform X2 [Armigeres subalbatus]|uniref:uncharacterized protein LOC134226847 isoform X2 n=1 Tax=Armigeres subalbatus TaxID=124917 RepID=UPI002ED6A63B